MLQRLPHNLLIVGTSHNFSTLNNEMLIINAGFKLVFSLSMRILEKIE